ncbi:hypothetical protein [Nonomuraea sp. NPDC050310]|uniref:hypothetical protein n=1 Tax=Nonomuraea sp. NPDC050310 TaxID=3154935 RepID=UPI0033F7C55A
MTETKGTSHRPVLAAGSRLAMVWKGQREDRGLWFALWQDRERRWSPQQPVRVSGGAPDTRHAPGLWWSAEDELTLAWTDAATARIQVARAAVPRGSTADEVTWTGRLDLGPDYVAEGGPVLGRFPGGALHLAWRARTGTQIRFKRRAADGSWGSGPKAVPSARSDADPAIVLADLDSRPGLLYRAPDTGQLKYRSLHEAADTPSTVSLASVTGVPAWAEIPHSWQGDYLRLMAWIPQGADDVQLSTSSETGGWSTPVVAKGIRPTKAGLSAAGYRGRIFLAWSGAAHQMIEYLRLTPAELT